MDRITDYLFNPHAYSEHVSLLRGRHQSVEDWCQSLDEYDAEVRARYADAELVRIDAYYNRTLYPDPRIDPASEYPISTDALMLLRAIQGGWTHSDRMQHTITLWTPIREDVLDWAWTVLNEDNRHGIHVERSLSVGDVLVCVTDAATNCFKVLGVGWELIPYHEFEPTLHRH